MPRDYNNIAKARPLPQHPLRDGPGKGVYPGCDYTPEQLEFLRAMDRLKRLRGPCPSWQDVFAAVWELGYRKVAEPTPLPKGPA